MIKKFQDEYRWLSNFEPVEVELDGVKYPSVENAYQAAKTLDLEERKQFETCTSLVAKIRGKNLVMWSLWDSAKLLVMYNICRQKYAQEPYKTLLLETGDQELQEGNWWGDVYWGVCRGQGENNLGKLIMKIRNDLRKHHG